MARTVAALLVIAALAAGCGEDRQPGAAASTLQGTLVDRDGDGFLEAGPPEPLRDRTEVGGGGKPAAVLATLAQLTDTHVRDEESPARVPFLDRLGAPLESTFRPQEALSTQVLAAAVRATDRLGPDAVFVTGDIVDNAEDAELTQALEVLDGGTVRPDTGAPGYDGVQEKDEADPLYYRPDLDAPAHPGMLAAAQRPFRSPGLRAPWFPALGNHDVLVQGEVKPTARLDAFATGTRMVTGLDPALGRPGPDADSAAIVDQLLREGAPGRARTVAPDPARRFLRPEQTIARLTVRAKAPDALRAAAGRTRLDYAIELGPDARALVLDTADRQGGSRGRLAPAQLAWLRAQLGTLGGRALLVFAHNPLDNTDRGEEALRALDATPGVVAVINGNGHRNRITPRRTARGGYWQIATASLADFPQQVRALRLRRSTTGGYVLETWMLDHDGAGLAGTARELAYLDAQGGRPRHFAGSPADRNARLHIAP
jgi:3',5'-cyclic AMP phosphodiesterase CpdA